MGIKSFLILLVQQLPFGVAVVWYTKIVVQLSGWLGTRAQVGRGSPWPGGTGPGSLCASPIW